MPYTDMMIDLETYGIDNNAAVIQIAAVPFELEAGKFTKEEPFKKQVSLISSVANGGVINQSTVDWWETQDPKLHQEVISGTESLPYVLHKLNSYFGKMADSNTRIWAHATFDPVVLISAYKGCGIVPTFKYWQHKDLRTLEELANTKNKKDWNNDKVTLERPPFHGRKHDALADCMHQIECAVLWYNVIMGV